MLNRQHPGRAKVRRRFHAAVAVILLATLVVVSAPVPAVQAAPFADDTPISAREIFAQVSPAIAFIETPVSSGSGVLFQQRDALYILTNSHVVWPYDEARVYFPNGEDLVAVPLLDWDLLADIAILGPVDVNIEPIDISEHVLPETGDPVYQIGYPGESDYYPDPALTHGIVSKLRTWETVGLTYIQADAVIVGGQSGGAMLGEDGAFLGLTTFLYGDTSAFSLALSVVDIRRRVARIFRGFDVDQLGERGRLMDDVDDGLPILMDTWRYGFIDFAGDVDMFTVELKQGQYVVVWAESFFAMDPLVAIGPADGHEGELFFGESYNYTPFYSETYYEAPEDGEYVIWVQDYDGNEAGAYVVGLYEDVSWQ